MSAGRKADTIGLDVNIMGRDYRIACKPEEQSELLEAVAYLDSKMKEIRDAAKQNNAERVAVMAALNVAHELLRARANPATLSSGNDVDLSGSKRRIQAMQSTIDSALSEQERLI